MTAKVILNPYSNRWNAQKRWAEAEIALRAAGVDFELAVSEGPGHIGELTRQALLDGFSPLIAAGGDGTIGEMVNAIGHASSADAVLPTLGIIPLGTANDMAYALKIPSDLGEAARVISAGKIRSMDMGKANDIYFANNSALGIEPYVSVIQNKITWIKGIGRYLVAAVMAITAGPSWMLTWNGMAVDMTDQSPWSMLAMGHVRAAYFSWDRMQIHLTAS